MKIEMKVPRFRTIKFPTTIVFLKEGPSDEFILLEVYLGELGSRKKENKLKFLRKK
jgi:hypothetical protein